jgi:hypothetical protein
VVRSSPIRTTINVCVLNFPGMVTVSSGINISSFLHFTFHFLKMAHFSVYYEYPLSAAESFPQHE